MKPRSLLAGVTLLAFLTTQGIYPPSAFALRPSVEGVQSDLEEKLAPSAAGLEEDGWDPSTITLPKLVGTHPFPIRVFVGADREEAYVPNSFGKMIYPHMQLLGETVKRRAGNQYASQLDPKLVYYLATATPQQIASQSEPKSRNILTKLKQLIDEVGVASADMSIEAAVHHLTGPYGTDGVPSYANLIGYVNRVLANERNPRRRLILPPIQGPEGITSLNLWAVKEGDITQVFQAEIALDNGQSVRLAINVAKDRALAADFLARDYQAMIADYARDPRFIMEPYALGTGVATAWNGKVEIPVFVAEWLDGFHELHLYTEHQGRFSVWLDHRTEKGTPLSREESDQIRVSIGKIQALYYPAELQGMGFGKARINGGDFVARKEPSGSWQVMMVWHRANIPAAGLEEQKKPITRETRRWEAGLDVVTPVNEADLPGFAQWIAWNGAASHLLHQRDYQSAAFDWAAYLNTNGEAVLGLPAGTPVRAIASGRVIKAFKRSFGNGYHGLVEIEHGEPGSGFSSFYVHVDPSVKPGDEVDKGALIGRLFGETDGSTLVHLHSELANALPAGISPYVYKGTGGYWREDDRYWVDPETTIYSDIPFLRATPQRVSSFRLPGIEREVAVSVSGTTFLEGMADKRETVLAEVTSPSFRQSGNKGALIRARALLRDPALGLSQAEQERLVAAFPELAAGPPAGGLEEQAMAVLDEAAPQGEGVLVLEAGVLGRAGLEEFVGRLGPALKQRVVLFGKGSVAAKEAAARNGVVFVDSDDPADLAFRLVGLEERANRIGYVGDRKTAGVLARILPASMAVTALDPRTTLLDMFRFLGYPSALLDGINASGLEEGLARSRAA